MDQHVKPWQGAGEVARNSGQILTYLAATWTLRWLKMPFLKGTGHEYSHNVTLVELPEFQSESAIISFLVWASF